MHSRILLAAAVVAALSLPRVADAEPGYHVSPWILSPNVIACFSSGGGVETRVAYWGEPTPMVGDIDGTLVFQARSTCMGSATVVPDFQLPPGVELDTRRNVDCFRKRGRMSMGLPFSAYPASEGGCSNTPIVPNPKNLKKMYAWFYLGQTDFVEIHIPVVFTSPQTQGAFRVDAHIGYSQSTWSLLQPIIMFDITARPSFSNMSSTYVVRHLSWMQVELDLHHQHFSGALYIDYGTTTSLGTTVAVGTTNPQYASHVDVTFTLKGLDPETLYYWQPRLVTANATFTGDMQSGRPCVGKQCGLNPLP